MGFTGYVACIISVAGAACVVAGVVRECIRGTRPVVVTVINILAAVAFFVLISLSVVADRSVSFGQYRQAAEYIRMQPWAMMSCMLLIILGALAGPFFDPKARRQADELVKRYQGPADDR